MSNKNKEAFEQMRRLTKEAKKFYAHNYNPGSLYPPRDTKFFLNEEYIPFDFETDYDDPLYTEYRRVRMLKNPFEDEKEDKNSLQDISDDLVKDDNINENYKYQNDWNKEQRIDAIKNDISFKLKLQPNNYWNNNNFLSGLQKLVGINKQDSIVPIWPKSQTIGSHGAKYVKFYDKDIELAAQKHNIDPDWLRAVMFTENATGHWYGGNEWKSYKTNSGSQVPMNINGNIWSTIGNQKYNTQNAYQNIEASAALLKRLSQTQDNPNNLLAIGTLWNNISANKINKIGVRIDDAYRRKLWEDKRISDNINNPYKTILNGIYDRTGFYGYEIPQGVSHKYNANYFFDNILPSERN